MRFFYIISVLLLIITGCGQQQVKRPDVIKNSDPTVIDFPAGIMINQNKQLESVSDKNTAIAQKLLFPFQIPVLDTVASEMIFIKSDGDRITISMNELAGKYDIILFNAQNNPVPLKISDLQKAVQQIFHKSKKANSLECTIVEQKIISDTLKAKRGRDLFSSLKNRQSRLVYSTSDSVAQGFISRAMPGLVWVEHKTDPRSILNISFENDLITYANTDRYFTNGITFDLQTPRLAHSSLQKLMIPYRNKASVRYNISMVQDMYTPTDTRIAPTLKNDRPYSSILYFGYRKTIADQVRGVKISSQLIAGYIGPYSPGSYMQTLVHKTFPTNDVPLGWETQINTDLILNYNISAFKALINNKNLTIAAVANAKAGTLINTAGAGLQIQAGKAEPFFGLADNAKWPETEYYFFGRTNVGFVAYNALLQGGMFNRSNIFTLNGNEIMRVVGNAEVGFRFRYKGVGIELSQHYLSPEYKGGLWHKWGRMNLIFNI